MDGKGVLKLCIISSHSFIDNTMLSTKSFQLGFKLSHRILIEIRTAFSVFRKAIFFLSKYKLFGMFVSVFCIVSVVAFAEEIIYIGS